MTAKRTAALPLSFVRARGAHARGLGTVRGAAVIWGDVAKLGRGRFALKEQFQRGALKPYDRGVIANVQHNRSQLLAQYPDGGLRLESRDRGYFVEIDLPNTTAGYDAMTLIEGGALRGLSIEFLEDKTAETAPNERVITAATLTGVSIVDRPAYPQSDLKLMERWLDAPPKKSGTKRRKLWL